MPDVGWGDRVRLGGHARPAALDANGAAAVTMISTLISPAAGMLPRIGVERIGSQERSLLGGPNSASSSILARTRVQIGAMLVAVLWRQAGEQDRKGIDMSDHGGRAYNY